ncbi:3-hydroxyacyl-CoA dehydrogenase family protein [Desulfosporosinus youngiae]|uniref:L-gulonate 3-dehydrogenase n=1 Tax=Desulfosporosinus youngiae DSM 17734 TaxID=768710 RepID=H5Y5B0_9FIRM|nr:3-hydroxyacyl-CoA dehydrogenase family protein [Desulfosporosinus youngiae]EHQ90360.1 3-hydroxyacyl-CoA dehydrogenase [Desulfosporosinus youngiae DSM 17734]
MLRVETIKRICNLGTGTIGPSITLTFAMAGYQVFMFGRSDASVKRGFQRIETILGSFCENNIIQKNQVPEIMGRIKGVTTLEEAAEGADFVIEGIVENLIAKQEVFGKMEELCPANTVFASSTSGLSPTLIAEKLDHKDRFVAAHFWNPPHLIPLVEVVPGKHTSQKTVDFTAQLMEKVGKKPVVLNREALGFIGNRLQFAMLREALYLIESGIATKEAVDTTIKYTLGRRLAATGPFESADLSGLDIINNIASYLFEDLCNHSHVSPILRELVDQGNLGAKNGSGFYEWTIDELTKINKIRENDLIQWLNKDKTGRNP